MIKATFAGLVLSMTGLALGHGFALPAVTNADNSLGSVSATLYVTQPQSAVISGMVLNLGVDAGIEIADVVVDAPETVFTGRIATSNISTYANGGSSSPQLASASVQTSQSVTDPGVLAVITLQIPASTPPGDYAITTAPTDLGPSNFTPTSPHYQGSGIIRVAHQAHILAAYLFHNNSGFDGNRETIDVAPIAGDRNDDGDAVDLSKVPLTSGTATFANWTGCTKGITGLAYDVANATRAPAISDFTCVTLGKAGTSAPAAVSVQGLRIWPGAGVNGSDRVFIIFATNSVVDTWLRVTVGTGFGLANPVVHYWGSAAGDCGSVDPLVPTNIVVNSTDELDVRNHPRTSGFNPAPVDWAWDLDKDGFANATGDQYYVRTHNKTGFTCVKVITVP